jgi:membrane-associated phospholipid phosphatase
MHFKARYNRPRPGQLYPALMAPVPSPGHPSYPNAHMLQARLMSMLVCMAEQGFVAAVPNETIVARLKDAGETSRWPFLEQLADRVGQNREIAGLHYPSDTAAGKCMADQIAELLVERSALLTNLLKRANEELKGEAFLK